MIMNEFYNEKILKVFQNPKNVGVLKGANAIGKAVCEERNDLLRFYLKIDKNKIMDAKFKAMGSSTLIAVASVTTQLIKGKPISILEDFDTKLIENEIGEVAEYSKYCLTMVQTALLNALSSYRKN